MFGIRKNIGFLVYAVAFAAAGCQGGAGTTGLTIPQTGAYGNPNGPSTSQSISRQQILDGTTEIDPTTSQVKLPTVGGFAIAIDVPSASADVVSPLPTGSALAASAAPSGSPVAGASAAPPTPAASSSPSPAATASSTASAKGAATSHAAAKIVTKLVIYPDKPETAPTPTPQPSGSPLPSIISRAEIARGTVSFATATTIAGLAAIHVTVPTVEALPARGFTIAVYRAGKKHPTVVAFDSAAALAKGVVSGTTTTPLTFEKGTAYAIELFGDPLPATPAPVGTYPTPGNNPFAPPSGMATALPGSTTGVPGAPNPGGIATAVPGNGSGPTPYP